MLRSFRRSALQRAGLVLVAAVLHLLSVSPSAAKLVYCIGADGHSGVEWLQSGGTGCVDCCHEIVDDAGTFNPAPNPGLNGCRDVLLSATDALANLERENPDGLTAIAVGLPSPLALPIVVRASSVRGFAPCGPLRASATRLLRNTVLLI